MMPSLWLKSVDIRLIVCVPTHLGHSPFILQQLLCQAVDDPVIALVGGY